MSLGKMGKTLPKKSARDLEQKIAIMVASALRKDFPKLKYAARAIAHEVDINFDAVKKWYNGQNAPSSGHFLMLTKISPSLFDAFLQETGYGVFPEAFPFSNKAQKKRRRCDNCNGSEAKDDPINDPIKFESSDLTERQVWFLNELRLNRKASTTAVVRRWGVSQESAKRDIRALKGFDLIAFVGARKTGRYVLL